MLLSAAHVSISGPRDPDLRCAPQDEDEKNMLEITNLHAGIDGKEILKGLTLHIGTGEVHAIMGPNGSGKSTLANVRAGRPKYVATSGTVTYQGKDLLALPAEERA